MVVTLGQQYSVGEISTIILYTHISRHTRPPNATKTRDTIQYIIKKIRL